MAKLLIINEISYRDGVNNPGDIVGVYPDDHEFTQGETECFNIVEVKDTTPDEFREKLFSPVTKIIWQGRDGNWKEKVKDSKYRNSINGLTTEDISELLSDDAVARDAVIANVKNGLELIDDNVQTAITMSEDLSASSGVVKSIKE
jgi:hypothetical protein